MTDFRPASPDEAERMAALEARVASWPWSARQYRDSLAGPHRGIVLEQDGQAVGQILLMCVLDEAEILNIAIDLPWQGRGLGRSLLDHALQTLSASGIRRVFLEVRESNHAAQALYTRRGFRRCGLRKHYYPGVDGREHAILMEIEL